MTRPLYGTKTKFKDRRPEDTIAKARSILHDLGVLTKEEWNNPLKSFYSVYLSISGTGFATNGKGVSPEYALASAYGEFMERLQNHMLMRYAVSFGKDVLSHSGFILAPDEKRSPLSPDAIRTAVEEARKSGLVNSDSNISAGTLKELFETDCGGELVSIPFRDVKTGGTMYIPYPILDIVFKSNGMCAGNTRNEAVVQGIAEIIERHVNRRILDGEITPPDIPREFIARFPACLAMVEEIQRSGNFSLVVKDCSLGEGYPVAAVIFIDNDTQEYFVKFGSHPVFQVALERTLTELMQGKNIKNMSGLKPYSARATRVRGYANWERICVHGSGHYPARLFSSTPSYPFSEELFSRKYPDNEAMAESSIRLLRDKGFTVLLRDISFLGFPAFHVLVPEISKIMDADFAKEASNEALRRRTWKTVRDLDSASDEDLLEAIDFVRKNNYNNEDSLIQLSGIPLSQSFPWANIRTDLFLSTAYCRLGRYEEASECLERFLNDMGESLPPPARTYYRCLRDILGHLANGESEESTADLLGRIYPQKLLREALSDLGDKARIFKHYGKLNCWDCAGCAAAGNCIYPKARDLQIRLKERYAGFDSPQKTTATAAKANS